MLIVRMIMYEAKIVQNRDPSPIHNSRNCFHVRAPIERLIFNIETWNLWESVVDFFLILLTPMSDSMDDSASRLTRVLYSSTVFFSCYSITIFPFTRYSTHLPIGLLTQPTFVPLVHREILPKNGKKL